MCAVCATSKGIPGCQDACAYWRSGNCRHFVGSCDRLCHGLSDFWLDRYINFPRLLPLIRVHLHLHKDCTSYRAVVARQAVAAVLLSCLAVKSIKINNSTGVCWHCPMNSCRAMKILATSFQGFSATQHNCHNTSGIIGYLHWIPDAVLPELLSGPHC